MNTTYDNNATNNSSVNNYGNVNNTTRAKKTKAYRNRPSKRQALLELLSFCLILAAAPAFLGGVFSIFICIFTMCLGLIGLFTWTRRHAVLFAILALAIIGACIVNIILRSQFTAQCVPFFRYSNQFNNNGVFVGNDDRTDDDDDNTFNNSIWCGNRKVVYITNAIILALALPALLVALSLLKKRVKNVLPVMNKTSTTTTQTRTVATA